MIDKLKNPAVPIKFVNNFNLYIIIISHYNTKKYDDHFTKVP